MGIDANGIYLYKNLIRMKLLTSRQVPTRSTSHSISTKHFPRTISNRSITGDIHTIGLSTQDINPPELTTEAHTICFPRINQPNGVYFRQGSLPSIPGVLEPGCNRLSSSATFGYVDKYFTNAFAFQVYIYHPLHVDHY